MDIFLWNFLTNAFIAKKAPLKCIRNSASSGLQHVVDLGCGYNLLHITSKAGILRKYTQYSVNTVSPYLMYTQSANSHPVM